MSPPGAARSPIPRPRSGSHAEWPAQHRLRRAAAISGSRDSIFRIDVRDLAPRPRRRAAASCRRTVSCRRISSTDPGSPSIAREPLGSDRGGLSSWATRPRSSQRPSHGDAEFAQLRPVVLVRRDRVRQQREICGPRRRSPDVAMYSPAQQSSGDLSTPRAHAHVGERATDVSGSPSIHARRGAADRRRRLTASASRRARAARAWRCTARRRRCVHLRDGSRPGRVLRR